MASDVFGIVGTTVAGIFHVEAVVAEGGFAVVYRAQHAVFRAPVALKCLKIPEHLTAEERGRFEQQFQAEAEVLFKLSAGIAAVVRPLHVASVVTPRGRFMPFLALEWLEGETLDAAAQRRAKSKQLGFSLDELIELLTPVARALENAHHFTGPDGPISIVHRDVKPENVFIARTMNERVVKILDFGIAKVKSLAKQVTTGRFRTQQEERASSFSPAFGAPEQWLPARYGTTGPWTDVWGLALTMVETLAGRPIVDGDDTAMMGTAIDLARRPTPRTEGVPVGDAVEVVFERALSVNPQARFRHAGEFWNALLAAQADDRKPRTPAPALRRMAWAAGQVVHTGGAAPLLRQHAIPAELDGPRALGLQLDVDEQAVASGRYLGQSAEPESGEWQIQDLAPARWSAHPDRLSSSPPAPSAGGWSAHPERRSSSPPPGFVHSTMPPAVGRPHRAAVTAPAPSRPPGRYGEADLPVAAPIASGVRTIAPRASAPVGPQSARGPETSSSEDESLARLAAVPAALVGVGVLLTVLNGFYAGREGEVLTLGPVRLAWIAAFAVLSGVGLATYRLWARMD